MLKNKLLIGAYFARLILSLVFIVYFIFKFDYSVFFIFLHIFIIFLLLLSEFLAIEILISTNLYRHGTVLKLFVPLIPSLLFTFLIFLYVSNTVMNNLWLENLHINYLIYLARDFNDFYANTGIKLAWILSPFFILFFATYLVFLFLIKNYAPYIKKLSDTAKKISALCFLSLILATAFILFVFQMPKDVKVADPIISFLTIERYPKNDSLGISDIEKEKYFDSIDYKNTNKKNILIIFMDSARAMNFSMYGYERNTTPFLSSLYKDGKLAKVDYFFSTCPESVCGTISVFSSKSRKNFDLYNAGSEILLQNILHKLGYKNYFISSCNQRASKWSGLEQSYAEDFDLLIDENTQIDFGENTTPNWYKSGTDDKLAIFGVNQIPNSDGNHIFATIWLFSPHHNGKKEKEFDVFNPTQDVINIKDYIAGKIKNTEVLVNRYDNGLVQTDYYISQIFELLSKKGYLDNSLVFIMGDHGDSVGENGYYGHGFHLYNEEIKVPLLIYSSDGLEVKNSDFASQTDIAPTIMDMLGVPAPKQWEGLSLLNDLKKTSSIHELTFSGNEKVMIMKKDDKLYKYFYISNKNDYFDESAEQKLYEIYSDPYEDDNIINSISKDLKNELKRELIKKFGLELFLQK